MRYLKKKNSNYILFQDFLENYYNYWVILRKEKMRIYVQFVYKK